VDDGGDGGAAEVLVVLNLVEVVAVYGMDLSVEEGWLQ
jgi:hypothetical protein